MACYELSNSAKEITYESSVKKIGTGIVTLTVFLFAIFIICDFTFGSYFVCMLLPIGFIMTSAGFQHESDETKKVSANIGLVLSAVYAVLILLVYKTKNSGYPG